jgi:hypothetical protein
MFIITFTPDIAVLGPYSQHFIFFVSFESAQQARLLYNINLERLASDKQSNLLGQSVSYKENEVLWIQPLGLYSQLFIFFVTYKLDQ